MIALFVDHYIFVITEGCTAGRHHGLTGIQKPKNGSD